MEQYLAVKTFPYATGGLGLNTDGLTLPTGPFEAQDLEDAIEKAERVMAEINAFLACMPGRIQLYRLNPLRVYDVGVNVTSSPP